MIFTVAIPVYNGEKSIEKCLDSIFSQEFEHPFEVVVSNNNSSDGTGEILKRYENKIKIVDRDNTVPMFANHNLCLENALGDYIIYCHADDILLPDALKKYYNILSKRQFPKKYVLWGRSMFRDFYKNWRNTDVNLNEIICGELAVTPFLMGGLSPSGVCYSRNCLLTTGGFCSTSHRLGPFDMTTMLKLCSRSFEMEMSERIFFVRMFASTATTLHPKEVQDSIGNAFVSLQSEISANEFAYLIKLIKTSDVFNANLLKALVVAGMMTRSDIKRLVVRKLLNKPSLLLNPVFLKQTFRSF